MSKSIEIIKGYDRNHVPFSAFVLCDADERQEITAAVKSGKKPLDLTKACIIYKMVGHNVTQKIVDDVMGYLKHRMVSDSEKYTSEHHEAVHLLDSSESDMSECDAHAHDHDAVAGLGGMPSVVCEH